MDNINFSRYRNINSIVHKIDPITKLLAFLFITISMFWAQTPETLLFVFIFVLVVSILSRIRFSTYFKILFIIVPFFVSMYLIYALVYWDLNKPINLVSMMSLRFYMFILIASIYTSTTREMEIAGSIEWLITPLRFIKVPTYEISMMIMLAIRFIPLLILDLKRIMIAQTSRGVNVINGSPNTKIKGIFNSLLPMFVVSFKRSDDIAKAMTIRGYEIGQKRSKFKTNKFKILELIALIICIALLVATILMSQNIIPGDWL